MLYESGIKTISAAMIPRTLKGGDDKSLPLPRARNTGSIFFARGCKGQRQASGCCVLPAAATHAQPFAQVEPCIHGRGFVHLSPRGSRPGQLFAGLSGMLGPERSGAWSLSRHRTAQTSGWRSFGLAGFSHLGSRKKFPGHTSLPDRPFAPSSVPFPYLRNLRAPNEQKNCVIIAGTRSGVTLGGRVSL